MPNNQPDLTKNAPRSPRVRLGGFVILPRMLDKGRATLAGVNGEYHFACPLDQQFLNFAGIDPEALKSQLAAGKGDWEILQWIKENSSTKPCDVQIAAWASAAEQRAPANVETRAYFNELHKGCGAHREDIASWFDLLDVDDYVSFGGKA